MELTRVRDLRRLAVVAPALEHLQMLACFYHHWQRRPVVSITARQLKVLKWGDLFDRRSVEDEASPESVPRPVLRVCVFAQPGLS
jgi:hypothetical protein